MEFILIQGRKMFEDFQLAAIIKQRRNTRLLRIPLHQGLQDTLAESWREQHEAFVQDIDEIDFNAGYQPEEHERFRLQLCIAGFSRR